MKTEPELQAVEPAELLQVEGGIGFGDIPKITAAIGKAIVDTIVTVLKDVASGPAPK